MNLPNALVIGAAKCGTTSLRYNLASHPLVCERGTDLQYLENRWVECGRDDGWYASRFRTCGSKATYFIDSAPSYLLFPYVFDRMKEVVPDAKLLVLLREPVSRAWSHHNMLVNRWEKRSFRDAINQCMMQLPVTFDHSYENELAIKNNIVNRGLYARQLKLLFDRWPRDQIHIEITERFKADRKTTIKRVLAFLNLEYHDSVSIEMMMRGVYKKRVMEPQQTKRLQEFYQPYNDQLRELLQDDLPEWHTGV